MLPSKSFFAGASSRGQPLNRAIAAEWRLCAIVSAAAASLLLFHFFSRRRLRQLLLAEALGDAPPSPEAPHCTAATGTDVPAPTARLRF
jgi:hypothetical protein